MHFGRRLTCGNTPNPKKNGKKKKPKIYRTLAKPNLDLKGTSFSLYQTDLSKTPIHEFK
jgi:hypothetical protein